MKDKDKNKKRNAKRRNRKIKGSINLRWSFFLGNLSYLFTPGVVIAWEFVAIVLCNTVCVITMFLSSRASVAYDVALAVMTGITASGILAVIVEMTNNFRRNTIRSLTLSELFSFLSEYEEKIAILTGVFDSERQISDLCKELHMEKKSTETDEEMCDVDSEDLICYKERVGAVLSILPDLIPIVKDAYQNHCAELKAKEVFLLKQILMYYHHLTAQIKFALYDHINFFNSKSNDRRHIKELFGANTAKHIEECIDLDINHTKKEKMIDSIAEEMLLRGDIQLQKLNITLSDNDAYQDDELEGSNHRSLASILLGSIDTSIIELSKIVDKEPGYNSMHKYSLKEINTYKKSDKR